MKFSERISSSDSSDSNDGDAYLVTNADKVANTPAYQGYLAGKKSEIDGKPMYKAADHLKESEPVWENPLDSMPVANGSNRYAPPEKLAELEAELVEKNKIEENPRPEEDLALWFSDKKDQPDESDVIEEEKTMHQKMYEIATSRYNPFSVGGSENCDSDISCNIGGSESITS